MAEKNAHVMDYVNDMMVLVKSYESFFRANAGDLNISVGEVPILLSIYRNEGLNQIDLVRKFHVTEANISKTTKNLYMKGFLVKEIDKDNNTKKLLFLTDKGKEACNQLLDAYNIWKDDVIGDISPEELSAFAGTLKTLANNSSSNI